MEGIGRTCRLALLLGATAMISSPASSQTQEALVQASKDAETVLQIYSNMGPENWQYIKEGFEAKYPWITVETTDLGGSEVFTRYFAETGTGAPSADLMVTGSITGWLDFAQKGELLDYETAHKDDLPDWSIPMAGLYTFSTDPMLLAYNKLTVPEALRGTSFVSFAEAVAANPDVFDGKIGTYDGDLGFGQSIFWAFLRDYGEAGWALMDKVGESARPGGGSGGMIEKLVSGENSAALFVSSTVLFPRMKGALQELVDWTFMTDGTPVFLRGMAIPKSSKNVNAAKLMVDFILSKEGQVAVGKGGFTPYREDVSPDEVPYETFGTIVEETGGRVILINYDPDMLVANDAFVDRWRQTFNRK